MRHGLTVFVAVVAVACSPGVPAASPSPGVAATASNGTVRENDERCARDTFVTFMTAVNKGNRSLLTPMLGDSFMWLTIEGSTTSDRRDAVERLLGLSQGGQQWELRQLEVNGRGAHGGIDFGVVIRRTALGATLQYRDAAGKGVIDCPDGRIRFFGLGGAD